MKEFSEINKLFISRSERVDGSQGIIQVPDGNKWIQCTCVYSHGAGWDHVSVAPINRRITLSWSQMCYVKDKFFNEDEAVIQIHPPKSEYVNNVPNCLHLWSCYYKEMVLPPAILVGVPPYVHSEEEYINEVRKAYKLVNEKSPI